MLVLDSGKTLQGVAALATSITYTIVGDEVTAGPTDTYKQLAQGQLPNATGVLYTVPGATSALVKSIHLANPSGVSVSGIQLFVGGAAGANAITGAFTLGIGCFAIYAQGGWQFFNAQGQLVQTGIQGPQGIQGVASGIPGEDGQDGEGWPGPQGNQGIQGIQGLPGIPYGEDGNDGEVGPQGVANITQPQIFTVGFAFVAFNNGTVSSGTFTPNPVNGNYQYYTNNGAHTLANPTIDCSIDILVTNGASASTITFTTFTVGSNTGDALDSTNAHKFVLSIRRINGVSTYIVKALQ